RRRWHVHPGLWTLGARHSSGASQARLRRCRPGAQAEGDPPDAVSAIPASPFDAGTVLAPDQVDRDIVPAVSAVPASDFGLATPGTAAQAYLDAPPGVS